MSNSQKRPQISPERRNTALANKFLDDMNERRMTASAQSEVALLMVALLNMRIGRERAGQQFNAQAIPDLSKLDLSRINDEDEDGPHV